MKPIRVGVIGAGWGQLQIEAFRRTKGTVVTALCDIDRGLAERLALKYKIPKVFTDYHELIRSDAEWIGVAAPPEAHAEIIKSAIEEGKNVFAEKPVSLYPEETQSLIAAASRKGIVHAVDLEMRYLPANLYLKELVDEDYLGRLLRVDVTMVMQQPWGEHGKWAADLARGGGILMELGSHFIDLVRWWFGEISSIVANSRTMFPSVRVPGTKEKGNGKSSLLTVTGDDAFWCVLQLANGGEATFNFVTGARHDAGWTINIVGQNGVFVNKSGQLWSMRDGDRELGLVPIPKRLELGNNPDDPLMWAMTKLIERAAAKIQGAPESLPFPTFEDSLAIERIISSVRVASNERRWIGLK